MLVKSFKIISFLCLVTALSEVVYGQESSLLQDVDIQAQQLLLLRASLETAKKNLVDINSELLVLRETAQFPERSQVVVFLAMDKLPHFQLESVELQLDGRVMSNHSYTAHEKEAIQKGGLHRLYTGNVNAGSHTVKAVFKGKLSGVQEYSDSVSYNFKKADKSKVFTLGIYDFLQDSTPEMTIREDR